MKILRNQILATTTVDIHGDRIPKEALQTMVHKMWSESFLYQDHDPSKPVVGRVFNYRLGELENGELCIRVDIEVIDENRFAEYGGLSIAFKHTRLSVNPARR